MTLNVNGYATGFNLVNGGPGFASTTFVTDNFLIAKPGAAGGAPVPIFGVSTVNGVSKIAIRGDVVADGSISAVKMNVGQLSAMTADMGTLTAGLIQSPTGKFAINLNSLYILIAD